MNELWSQKEYDSMTFKILDGNCQGKNFHLCKSALLHARQRGAFETRDLHKDTAIAGHKRSDKSLDFDR